MVTVSSLRSVSGTASSVTGCAVFQSLGVNVSTTGLTVTASSSGLLSVTVTGAVGSVASATVQAIASPPSVTVALAGDRISAGTSSSVTVAVKSAPTPS